jgi:hypothetical protein
VAKEQADLVADLEAKLIDQQHNVQSTSASYKAGYAAASERIVFLERQLALNAAQLPKADEEESTRREEELVEQSRRYKEDHQKAHEELLAKINPDKIDAVDPDAVFDYQFETRMHDTLEQIRTSSNHHEDAEAAVQQMRSLQARLDAQAADAKSLKLKSDKLQQELKLVRANAQASEELASEVQKMTQAKEGTAATSAEVQRFVQRGCVQKLGMHLLSEKWLEAKAKLAEQQRKLDSADNIISDHNTREKELSIKYGEEVSHSMELSAHITRLQEVIEEANSLHEKEEKEARGRAMELDNLRQSAMAEKKALMQRLVTESNSNAGGETEASRAMEEIDKKHTEAEDELRLKAVVHQDQSRKSMKMMYSIVKMGLKSKREKDLKAAEQREAGAKKADMISESMKSSTRRSVNALDLMDMIDEATTAAVDETKSLATEALARANTMSKSEEEEEEVRVPTFQSRMSPVQEENTPEKPPPVALQKLKPKPQKLEVLPPPKKPEPLLLKEEVTVEQTVAEVAEVAAVTTMISISMPETRKNPSLSPTSMQQPPLITAVVPVPTAPPKPIVYPNSVMDLAIMYVNLVLENEAKQLVAARIKFGTAGEVVEEATPAMKERVMAVLRKIKAQKPEKVALAMCDVQHQIYRLLPPHKKKVHSEIEKVTDAGANLCPILSASLCNHLPTK